MKSATLKIYKGGSHGLAATRADEFNADLLDFIEEGTRRSVASTEAYGSHWRGTAPVVPNMSSRAAWHASGVNLRMPRDVATWLSAATALCVLCSFTLARAASVQKTVVLVRGAFADGSSWDKVIPLLQAKGLKGMTAGARPAFGPPRPTRR